MNLLVKNDDFIIYGNNDLVPIANELIKELSLKSQEFLKLFKIESFPLVEINLFDTRTNYYDSLDNVHSSSINLCYQGVLASQLLSYLKKYILHEYVYLLFYMKKEEIPLWLKEGITTILVGEKIKLENDEKAFKAFYLDRIGRRDKEIPDKSFLNKKYKREFIVSKNNYNWEDFSYLLVHYLIENYGNINEIINNINKIKELPETLIDECITYYNQKYPVRHNFYDIETDEELMDYMNKNIIYGWLDQNKIPHVKTLENFREKQRIATIEEILNFGLGTCAEQAKLIKYWFDLKKIPNKIFCYRNVLEDNVKDDAKMHCFVLFYYQGFWYHFEHSTLRLRGIHKYDTLEMALDSIVKFYSKLGLNELTEIPNIPDGLTYQELNEYVSSFEIYEMDSRKR